MSTTKLVCIKKPVELGTQKWETPHFDVYIGRRVENIHWSLSESYWNDYIFKQRRGNPGTWYRLKQGEFRDSIISSPLKMKRLHSEVRNRTMGCWDADTARCHGHTLLYILEVSRRIARNGPIDFVYLFSGPKSPLSNFYQRQHFNVGPWKFSCVAHAYTYLRAKRYGFEKEAEHLLVVSSKTRMKYIQHLNCKIYSKQRQDKTYTLEEDTADVIVLIALKYLQVSEFRNECEKLFPHFLPMERSKNTHWSNGIDPKGDLADPDGIIDLTCVPGCNVLGWIMGMVHAHHSMEGGAEAYYKRCANDEWLPTNCPMRQGLESVLKNCRKIPQTMAVISPSTYLNPVTTTSSFTDVDRYLGLPGRTITNGGNSGKTSVMACNEDGGKCVEHPGVLIQNEYHQRPISSPIMARLLGHVLHRSAPQPPTTKAAAAAAAVAAATATTTIGTKMNQFPAETSPPTPTTRIQQQNFDTLCAGRSRAQVVIQPENYPKPHDFVPDERGPILLKVVNGFKKNGEKMTFLHPLPPFDQPWNQDDVKTRVESLPPLALWYPPAKQDGPLQLTSSKSMKPYYSSPPLLSDQEDNNAFSTADSDEQAHVGSCARRKRRKLSETFRILPKSSPNTITTPYLTAAAAYSMEEDQ
jgi:hypothetical protein